MLIWFFKPHSLEPLLMQEIFRFLASKLKKSQNFANSTEWDPSCAPGQLAATESVLPLEQQGALRSLPLGHVFSCFPLVTCRLAAGGRPSTRSPPGRPRGSRKKHTLNELQNTPESSQNHFELILRLQKKFNFFIIFWPPKSELSDQLLPKLQAI